MASKLIAQAEKAYAVYRKRFTMAFDRPPPLHLFIANQIASFPVGFSPGQIHAAYPNTFFPSRVAVVVGVHPRARRASSNSWGEGRWSQTATAVTFPNQLVS
jgi:hypothetical protein